MKLLGHAPEERQEQEHKKRGKRREKTGKMDGSKGVVLGSSWAAVFCRGNTLGLMWCRMWSTRTPDTSRRTKSDEILLVIVDKRKEKWRCPECCLDPAEPFCRVSTFSKLGAIPSDLWQDEQMLSCPWVCNSDFVIHHNLGSEVAIALKAAGCPVHVW